MVFAQYDWVGAIPATSSCHSCLSRSTTRAASTTFPARRRLRRAPTRRAHGRAPAPSVGGLRLASARDRGGSPGAPVRPRWRDGLFVALFLMGYGTARVVVELYRQPDAQFRGPDDPVGTVLGPLTMGQVLSIAMILTGALVLVLGTCAADPRGRDPSPARSQLLPSKRIWMKGRAPRSIAGTRRGGIRRTPARSRSDRRCRRSRG